MTNYAPPELSDRPFITLDLEIFAKATDATIGTLQDEMTSRASVMSAKIPRIRKVETKLDSVQNTLKRLSTIAQKG